MEETKPSVRSKIAQFVLILAGSLLAAIGADYLHAQGYMSNSFIVPIYAVIVLVAGYLSIRITITAIEKVLQPTIGATRGRGLKNGVEIVATILVVLAVFALFGLNVTGALVGAGFLGIVLGLAAQQVLGNIFGGISLLVASPFEIGDRVTLVTPSYSPQVTTYPHETLPGGFSGVIQDIGIIYTHILLDSGSPSVFPNLVVVGALVINHSRRDSGRVRVRMDLDKGVDYSKFKPRLLQLLEERRGAVEPEKSQVDIVDIGPDTVQVAITVWTTNSLEEPVKSIVIQEALKAEREFATRPQKDS